MKLDPNTLPTALPVRLPAVEIAALGSAFVTLFKLALVLAILTIAPILTALLSHAADGNDQINPPVFESTIAVVDTRFASRCCRT